MAEATFAKTNENFAYLLHYELEDTKKEEPRERIHICVKHTGHISLTRDQL